MSGLQASITTKFKAAARTRTFVVMTTQVRRVRTAVAGECDTMPIWPRHYTTVGIAHFNQVRMAPRKGFVGCHLDHIKALVAAAAAAETVFHCQCRLPMFTRVLR